MKPVDSISIKMYNTGSVGDCLFLCFKKEKTVTFTMLIDCGGYKTSKDEIIKCADDISKQLNKDPKTGKPYFDLVLLTHQHEDHASGFNQARDIFKDIDFKQVWMSWAEDESNPLAQKLLKEKGKKIKALTAALNHQQARLKGISSSAGLTVGMRKAMQLRSKNLSETTEQLRFEGGVPDKKTGIRQTIADAVKYVKSKSVSKSNTKMFRKPGQVIAGGEKELKGAEGIRFFILGPPMDEDLSGIKNKEDHNEMYSLAKHVAMQKDEMYFNGLMGYPLKKSVSPFAEKYLANESEKKKLNKEYNSMDMRWRQIEDDWLDSADQLAIAVNSYVNNTSLAIAIEFESSGEVLLFPADAQSGNWKSWHDKNVSKLLMKNGGKTADMLLKKTVFYKAGHHGSHNGTASKSGLDKMPEKGLVAFMPLVQDKVPSQWGGKDNFPAKALYKKMIEKTNGAIIRTDEGLIKDNRARDLRSQNLPADLITRLNKAGSNKLFKEWEVKA